LIVDKPKGVTSFEVVKKIRKLLPKNIKVGHTGTLDPLATGILIISIGKATRLSEYLIKQDKCYRVKGQFGISSDTYDIDGNVKKVNCPKIEEKDLLETLDKFKGEIEQIPPLYSAIRIKGKRAYELARKGKDFEISPRRVRIYSLELEEFNYPFFSIKVCCSSGTYVRSLIHDIGRSFGCDAVVVGLRRTKVGNITEDTAVPLDKIDRESLRKYLLSPEKVLPFPVLRLSSEDGTKFINGIRLRINLADGYRLVYSGNRFLGVGRVEAGVLKPEKVLFTKD
jgi:tRNA pseudouridine55 synthase